MKLQTIFLLLIVIIGFLLRFVDVSNNPPGLYTDEASIGYNAYKILTTGKDEYGVPHPLWFKSFGDYKLPVYIYSVAGAMAIFGKTEFAIRIPSIISGTLTIPVLYFFVEKLLTFEKDKKVRKKFQYLPLLSAFLLAISSWHIQFSRGGFEITMGTFLYLLGWYFFLFFKEKKSWQIITASIFCFVLSAYTYHVFRILAPLAFIFIAYTMKIYKNPKSLYFVALTILLFLPIFLFTLSPEGSERFNGTSAFGELAIKDPLQQIIIYPVDYLRNYLSFFSFDFLFSYGDGIGRHQIPNFGELFRWQLPFFLGGIFVLLRQKKSFLKNATFLLFFSAPLAGAFVVPSPHALRSLPLVIPCVIIIAVGILTFVQSIHKYRMRVAVIVIIALVTLYEFSLYLHFYYIHYPIVNQLDWGAGYKQMVMATSQDKNKYKHIIVDENLSFAPVYIHFYDSSIKFTMVPVTWKEPQSWENSNVLYIRPYYGQDDPKGVIKNIYLNGPTHPIFAQLWGTKINYFFVIITGVIELITLQAWIGCQYFTDLFHLSSINIRLQIEDYEHAEKGTPLLLTRVFTNKLIDTYFDLLRLYLQFWDVRFGVNWFSLIGYFGIGEGFYYIIINKKKRIYHWLALIAILLLPFLEILKEPQFSILIKSIYLLLPFSFFSMYGIYQFLNHGKRKNRIISVIILVLLSIWWFAFLPIGISRYCAKL